VLLAAPPWAACECQPYLGDGLLAQERISALCALLVLGPGVEEHSGLGLGWCLGSSGVVITPLCANAAPCCRPHADGKVRVRPIHHPRSARGLKIVYQEGSVSTIREVNMPSVQLDTSRWVAGGKGLGRGYLRVAG
jgi:hypothetical protein